MHSLFKRKELWASLHDQSFAAERLEIKLRVHSHGKFTNQGGKMSASEEEKPMEWGVKLNPFGL